MAACAFTAAKVKVTGCSLQVTGYNPAIDLHSGICAADWANLASRAVWTDYTAPTVVFPDPDAKRVLATVIYEPDFEKRAQALAKALDEVKQKLQQSNVAKSSGQSRSLALASGLSAP